MRSLRAKRAPAPQTGFKMDPAPSRWRWRLERWMLTPGFRAALRLGLPAALCLAGAGIYLSDEARRTGIVTQFTALKESFEARPEFQISLMSVEGASRELSAQIHDISPVTLPVSSFDLDLDALRQSITQLGAVKSATVRHMPGGILLIEVEERLPVAVWRDYDRVYAIDGDGVAVAELDTRLARPDLPVIAGQGAPDAVREALRLFELARPLQGRLRGLARMGERRWDVVLDREQRIMLPEFGSEQALLRVIAMDRETSLLERDVTHIDLRLSERMSVRMGETAKELRHSSETSSSSPRVIEVSD